jgi:hypothetical protein
MFEGVEGSGGRSDRILTASINLINVKLSGNQCEKIMNRSDQANPESKLRSLRTKEPFYNLLLCSYPVFLFLLG